MPLTVVRGPLAMAQILETSLLNHLNFQTLIATKAARIRESGRGQLMLEFGLRRAQDTAAIAGARAALIGGADFTSNVGISARPRASRPRAPTPTAWCRSSWRWARASWVPSAPIADVYPDDCLLLVDTIDTLESGVPNAIKVFEELRRKGHQPVGIRLDSGDLAYLAIQAAKMLDEAGFPRHVHRALQQPGRAGHLADHHPDRAGSAALRRERRPADPPAGLTASARG